MTMSYRSLRLSVLSSFLSFASTLSAQSVTPKFAWPAGTSAESRTTVVSKTNTAGRADSSQLITKSRMSIAAHPDGLKVESGPGTVESGSTAPSTGISADAMAGMKATYIVSTGGTFLRLDDTLATKQQMAAMMEPLLQQAASAAPAVVASIKKTMEVPGIEAAFAASWETSVTDFTTQSWSVGDSLVRTKDQAFPGAEGVTFPLKRVIRYAGIVQCPVDSQLAGECLKFVTRVVITRETMKPAMLQMLKQMGITDESVLAQIPVPETVSETTSILERRTLRSAETITDVTATAISGIAGAVGSNSTTRTTFRWSK